MTSQLKTEPVIVFTCGRTGSTLLIRFLNCLPETVVWGEHGGILKSILRSHARSRNVAGNKFITEAAQFLPAVLSRSAILNSRRMSIEWLNWFNPNDVDELYRNFITSLFYPPAVQLKFNRWGFKEIRYRMMEYEALRTLFPNWKPIILYRNPVDVCKSQFKSFAKNDTSQIAQITNNIENFYNFAANVKIDSEASKFESAPLFINYETMVWQFGDAVAALETYLEERFPAQIDLIRTEVEKFHDRRPQRVQVGVDEVERDLEAWVASMGTEIPRQRFRRIARNYQVLASSAAGV